MFSAAILAELRELTRLIPGLWTLRIRYTSSVLQLTTNIIEPGIAGLRVVLLFMPLLVSLLAFFITILYSSWPGASLAVVAGGISGFGLFRVNRRINDNQNSPPDFILGAAARRITRPPHSSWWHPLPALTIPFEEVKAIRAELLHKDTGYGESAGLIFSFHHGPDRTLVYLPSYAVTGQLAEVLRQIVLWEAAAT